MEPTVDQLRERIQYALADINEGNVDAATAKLKWAALTAERIAYAQSRARTESRAPGGMGGPMNTYNRCQCKHGDHDLDGKPDHCLNDAGKGHRLCVDCRKPYGGKRNV